MYWLSEPNLLWPSSKLHGSRGKEIEIRLGEDTAESVEKFCFLGDVLGAGGGAKEALRGGGRYAWGKFHESALILTLKRASLKLKGKFYQTLHTKCVTIWHYYLAVTSGQQRQKI